MQRKPAIPKHFYLPFAMVVATNFFVFYATRLVNRSAVHYDLSIWLDQKLPFLPEFIVIYVLAFAQWVLILALAAREGEAFYYKATSAEMSSKIFVFLFFLFLPTSMERGVIRGDDIFDRITALIYALDTPDNLFPSIHCLDSWMCLRVVCKMEAAPKWFKLTNAVFSLLVFAAVLLVKQHLVLDVLGGIAVGEVGFLMVRTLRTDRLLGRIMSR